MTKLPDNMPSLAEILIKTNSVPWREKSLKGISEKMLWRNEETGASIALIKFDKGAGIPQPHYHASNQFMFCLRAVTNTLRPESSSPPDRSIAIQRATYTGPRSLTRRPSSSKSMTARTIRRSRLGMPMSVTPIN